MKSWPRAWLTAAVILAACSTLMALGYLWLVDTDEMGSKPEWSILQSAEYDHRSKPLVAPEFFEHAGRHLVCVRGASMARVWIMLDPHHAPYYKQLPMAAFSLTPEECAAIVRQPYIDATVRECLQSHVTPTPP